MPTVAAYERALRQLKVPGGRQLLFLQAHVDAPGRALTMRRLASAADYRSHDGVNLRYGILANQIGRALRMRDPGIGVVAELIRPSQVSNSEWILVLHHELALAMKRVGWVSGGAIGRVSVAQLIRAIRSLPSDRPVENPRKWYKTQKEHWLGWLAEYHSAGAYGRQTGKNRDAHFAYNHIVEPKMLLWLIDAAGVRPALVQAAKRASGNADTLSSQSASIRQHVPWPEVAKALWGSGHRPV